MAATASLLRDVLQGARESSRLTQHDGTAVELSQFLIRDTVGSPEGMFGHGCFAAEGATLSLHSGALLRNRTVGVAAVDLGTTLTLEDVVVADTQPDVLTEEGEGIAIGEHASATLTRVRSVRNHLMGVSVFEEGESTITDLVVDATNGVSLDPRGTCRQGSTGSVRGRRSMRKSCW